MTATKPFIICLVIFVMCIAAGPVRGDWPDFRGRWGNGWATVPGDREPVGLPLHWSEKQNVKWKTAIPHRGWSTPVVADGQVWLTTATVDGHDFFVICVDAKSGAIRLNERLYISLLFL